MEATETPAFAPGIHKGIPAETYHRANGLSNSMLGQLEKSPGTLLASMANPPASTRAQIIGTLFHTFCLEPELAPAIVCKPEGFTRARKADKEWLAEQEAEGVLVLDKDEWDFIHFARENLYSHPFLKRLLSVPSQRELSLFHEDEAGILRKCRADLLPDSGNVLADLKSTSCTSIEEFSKSVFEWGYHRGAAWYLDICNALGMDRNVFGFIVASKTAPYAVDWLPLSNRAIEFGRKRYCRALSAYKHYFIHDRWDAPNAIELPEWAEYREIRAEEVGL